MGSIPAENSDIFSLPSFKVTYLYIYLCFDDIKGIIKIHTVETANKFRET